MKKALLLSVLLLALAAGLHAQAPQSVTLQSVLRDAAGRLVANQNIAVRLTLTQGSATGTVVYCETHAAVTNSYGLYSVLLGQGTPSQGVFSSIDWGNGPYFLTTEADPAGGTAYSLAVVQPLVSVPYALYADTAARVAQATTAADATHATNADHSTISDNATNALYADTARYYHERQVLTRGNDTIYLTGGSYVVLPPSSNANINNNYIDSVVRVNNTTEVNHYVDSVANAQNTIVQNIFQTLLADSSQTLRTDIQQTITSVIASICHATCCSVDSLERQLDSLIHVYDSLSRCLSQRIDSLSAANPAICECNGTIAVNGVLPGVFSVSATKQVKFSQGNLQYTTTGTHQCADGTTKPGTWRFADCQCQYVGDSNSNIPSTYEGWIDIFGWATSGYHDNSDPYNTKYQPYDIGQSASQTNNRYGYGPSTNMTDASLVGTSRYYDWGVYNAISNGGNTAGMWRTLTKDEWTYLTQTRSTTSVVGGTSNARSCKAVVSGVKGLILFPDNYVHPTGVPVPSNINQSNAEYSDIITSSQWGSMESAGCVFLPAAGWHRCDGSVGGVGSSSSYWSTTPYVSGYAWRLDLISSGVRVGYGTQCDGESVRLVQDVQ